MPVASQIARQIVGDKVPFYPIIGTKSPTMAADFVNNRYAINGTDVALDTFMTTTRSTTGFVADTTGALTSVAINGTRRSNRGLLVEEARTNSFLRSQEFDNVTWSKVNSSITVNAAVAPDGTTTADLFIPDTVNTSHSINQSALTATAGTLYAMSIYAKAEGYGFIRLSFGYAAGGGYTFFNLNTGVVGTTSGMAANFIESCGNGWYRCTVVRAAGSSAALGGDIYVVSADNQFSWSGNGTSGVYIWGAQLEAGAFPTSYIPTTSATVTRAKDTNVINNFGSWFNAAGGTVVIEAEAPPAFFNTAVYYTITDGLFNQSLYTQLNSSGQFFAPTVLDGGVGQASMAGVVVSSTGRFRNAAVYKVNDFRAYTNGTTNGSDGSGTIPVGMAYASIGHGYWGGTSQCNAYIRRIYYYQGFFDNTELQGALA